MSSDKAATAIINWKCEVAGFLNYSEYRAREAVEDRTRYASYVKARNVALRTFESLAAVSAAPRGVVHAARRGVVYTD